MVAASVEQCCRRGPARCGDGNYEGRAVLALHFVARVVLLLLFFLEQLEDFSPLGFVRYALEKLTVVADILASDEAFHGSTSAHDHRPRTIVVRTFDSEKQRVE